MLPKSLIWITILLPLLFDCTNSSNMLELEKQILDNILAPDKYDPSIRPAGQNETGPVVVEVNVFVRSISDINDVKMEYNSQLTFRQSWVDSRLKYDDKHGKLKILNLIRPEKIWRPDIFFSNEKSGHFHNIMMPNVLIRIYPDGKILYSTRISLKLSCPMDLRNYPMDNQICKIRCASYGYTTDDVKFIWKPEDPVQLTKDLHLPKFTLNGYFNEYCNSITTTGEYSCVVIDFHLSRDVGYHIERSFIPSTALVLFSWVPFWLNPRATTIRMAIWLGVLLAMFIEASSINSRNPPVSYTKAIDIWTGSCLLFISCVVLELCYIHKTVESEEKRGLQNHMDETLVDRNTMCIDDHGKQNQLHSYTFGPLIWLNRYPTKAQRIDAVSRYIFPSAFAFFNLIYWLSYTSHRMR